MLGPFICGSHCVTLWIWLFIALFDTVTRYSCLSQRMWDQLNGFPIAPATLVITCPSSRRPSFTISTTKYSTPTLEEAMACSTTFTAPMPTGRGQSSRSTTFSSLRWTRSKCTLSAKRLAPSRRRKLLLSRPNKRRRASESDLVY